MTAFHPERNIIFLEDNVRLDSIKQILDDTIKPEIMAWGQRSIPGLSALVARRNLAFCRVEDGFLRSVGLGAEHRPPHSICLDYTGIYFDTRTPSDLENILATHNFRRDVRLMDTARSALAALKASRLSKYNFVSDVDPREVYGPKRRKRVLVVGQVEDDASILFGAPPGSTNNNLVRLAREENPDAQVIYKIHPDVLARLRPELSDPMEVQDICQIVSTRMPLVDALHEVDHVYTLTSLAGFEALLRNIKVTTVGAPFYAGWGLTDARMPVERRQRKLKLEELFAAAYILYPTYFDPATGQPSTIEATIQRLQEELRSVEAKTAA